MLGRGCASGALLYRSFFPTIFTRWWAQVVRRVPRWLVFDACPVNACLPYIAARIAALTPAAKIVIMVRDPVSGVFSAEVMLRDMGVPLPWSFADPALGSSVSGSSLSQPAQQQAAAATSSDSPSSPPPLSPLPPAAFSTAAADCTAYDDDTRWTLSTEDEALWQQLVRLGRDDPLPADTAQALYLRPALLVRCAQYVDLIATYMAHFPRDQVMVVNLSDFSRDPERVVDNVLRFVGADTKRYTFQRLGAFMKVSVLWSVH